MKNLESYMKNLYISLEGLNEDIKDRLKNLDGYEINECCGCGCCCEDPCSCADTTCDKTCGTGLSGNTIPVNQFGRFNSELEITRELDSNPKVASLLDIYNQFNKFSFIKDVNRQNIEPLYFGHRDYSAGTLTNEIVNRENGDMPAREADPQAIDSLYDVETKQNKKIYKLVNDVVDTFEFVCPIVQTKINGEVQVYAIKYSGSNGKENSIKSSLEEIAGILGKLDKKTEIQWSQVLDVSIDNIDDLYTFVITFVVNPDKVREQIKKEI